ncbi:hypothetical protein SK224_08305 [Microbacterium sp. BG28]|uniref:hypothetical protein n=1 Tax=Microbacterium sp. BG28 TaxID=3097356 RepID=UPI002A59F015|nr:hypothetical protein [Microbacterium sp. BG28]MDY0829126.1 hypothetical protein [Microbacterium sp. BG28]
MASTQDQTRQTVDAYAAAQSRIVAALLRLLLGYWGSFTHWDSPDLVRAHAARSTVDVDVALAQVRALSRSYMVSRLLQSNALPARLPEVVESYERGGALQLNVYQRPARERAFVLRRELEVGTAEPDAIAKAQAAFEERLSRIVEADVQATARDETNKVLAASPKVIGYRRIIHPERSKTGTCGLCLVAADRLYSVKELMDIHDGCHCTVMEVTASADPGLSLNREDLDAIYAAAGSNRGDDLKNVRITSYEHGELGPVLIRKGSKFRSLEDVNKDTKGGPEATPYKRQTRADDQVNWRAMRATSERSIRYLRNAKSRGTNLVDITGGGDPKPVKDIDAAIRYHLDLIARAERHAA